MFDSHNLVILDQRLILSKEGKHDLIYENDTLLKVKMVSNQHMIVEDDHRTNFLLKQKDENVVWSFV